MDYNKAIEIIKNATVPIFSCKVEYNEWEEAKDMAVASLESMKKLHDDFAELRGEVE